MAFLMWMEPKAVLLKPRSKVIPAVFLHIARWYKLKHVMGALLISLWSSKMRVVGWAQHPQGFGLLVLFPEIYTCAFLFCSLESYSKLTLCFDPCLLKQC